MDLNLQGKVALVAASSKGLGKATALELAREGAKVAICARGREPLLATAVEIERETAAQVLAVVCDLSKADDLARLVQAAHERFGRIDILVNNAGGPPTGLFLDFDDAHWHAALELNLMSAVRLTRAVLSGMMERGWGRIINITSIMVKQPGPGFVLSTAARSAIVGMAKTLAADLAPYGITVNNVCPGHMLTDRVRDLIRVQAEREGKTPEEIMRATVAAIPAGRMGRPEELAALIAFLASERAGYITGATIQVDGGAYKGLL